MIETTPARQRYQRHAGDGWLQCVCGRRHWGLNGAAGLFLARVGPAGTVSQVLLQHRSVWSDQGGTWGIPGGAIATGEVAETAALREAGEEAGIVASDVEVIATIRYDHIVWSYTTVIAVERSGVTISPAVTDGESIAVEWVRDQDVTRLPLLNAFAAQYGIYRTALREAVSRLR